MLKDLHSIEGAQLLRDEINKLYEHLHTLASKNNFHGKTVYSYKNRGTDRFLNVVCAKHSLTFQHVIPYYNTTVDSFVSAAIYDLLFDDDGYSLNGSGQREKFDVDTHLLKYQMYEFTEEPKVGLGWRTHGKKDSAFLTSAQLAEHWFNSLIKTANH